MLDYLLPTRLDSLISHILLPNHYQRMWIPQFQQLAKACLFLGLRLIYQACRCWRIPSSTRPRKKSCRCPGSLLTVDELISFGPSETILSSETMDPRGRKTTSPRTTGSTSPAAASSSLCATSGRRRRYPRDLGFRSWSLEPGCRCPCGRGVLHEGRVGRPVVRGCMSADWSKCADQKGHAHECHFPVKVVCGLGVWDDGNVLIIALLCPPERLWYWALGRVLVNVKENSQFGVY